VADVSIQVPGDCVFGNHGDVQSSYKPSRPGVRPVLQRVMLIMIEHVWSDLTRRPHTPLRLHLSLPAQVQILKPNGMHLTSYHGGNIYATGRASTILSLLRMMTY
jgi:hypothetical protein